MQTQAYPICLAHIGYAWICGGHSPLLTTIGNNAGCEPFFNGHQQEEPRVTSPRGNPTNYFLEKVAHSVALGAAAILPFTAMLAALQAVASTLYLQVTTSHFTWGLGDITLLTSFPYG